jgi:hypothetical protein
MTNTIDISGLLKRAFEITFKNRGLWGLGFLAALASGGGGSFNSNVNLPGGSGGSSSGGGTSGFDRQLEEVARQISDNSGLLIAGIAAAFCAILVLSLILLIVAEIGHGGIISNADRLNNGEIVRFADGWRAGVARLRTMVGQRLLLELPSMVLAVAAIAVLPQLAGSSASGGGTASDRLPAALLGVGCIAVPLFCVAGIYGILAGILNIFGRRAVMLEGTGAIDGLKRGWAVFRANFTNSFLVGLIVWVVQAIVGVIVGIIVVAVIVVPTIGIVFAMSSSGSSSFNPVLIAFGVLAFLLVSVLSAAINSVVTAFSNTAWTLAYRSFTSTSTTPAYIPTPGSGQL